MATDGSKDLRAEAKNFCDSLANVFMRKKRDPQTQHLLEKSKALIESLLTEKRPKTERPAIAPKPSRAPGTPGQLWVKLDELKRENDELKKRIHGKSPDEKGSPGKAQGPGDVIIAEMHKTKLENDNIKVQLEKAQTLVKELEKINESVRDEYKRARIAQDTAQKSLEKIRKEQKNLESSLSSVQTENDSLKKRLTHSVKPMKRSTDNRFVENINERCRPSNIAVQYNNLESQEWMDAKESLEDAGYDNEDTVTQFLCAALTISYDVSTDLLADVEASISEVLQNPCKIMHGNFLPGCAKQQNKLPEDLTNSIKEILRQHVDNINAEPLVNHGNFLPGCAKQQNKLPEDLTNSIKEILRQHVDNINAEPLVNKCKDKILQDSRWQIFECILNNKPILRYLEQCVRITWQMVAQQTPMWLCVSDTDFDDEIHKLWWSCSQSNARTISYFIWPALYDCKYGNLMVKGCVYTSKLTV